MALLPWGEAPMSRLSDFYSSCCVAGYLTRRRGLRDGRRLGEKPIGCRRFSWAQVRTDCTSLWPTQQGLLSVPACCRQLCCRPKRKSTVDAESDKPPSDCGSVQQRWGGAHTLERTAENLDGGRSAWRLIFGAVLAILTYVLANIHQMLAVWLRKHFRLMTATLAA